MSKSSLTQHEELQNSVAENYRREGYEVSIAPGPGAIPFDVGGYAPDLIARKGNLSLIVEIRTQPERVSYDQLRAVVDTVKRHEGWRFVLVTSRDIPSVDLPGETRDQFSWDDASRRIEDADRLSDLGQKEAAYLTLWIALERMMRHQARQIALPVDRLSPSILIPQLYSHGELSMAQYDVALSCQGVRNRIVHGFSAADLTDSVTRLGALVRELIERWSVPSRED